MLNASDFRNPSGADPILTAKHLFFMEAQFGGFTDVFVLASEYRTGAYLDDQGGHFRQSPGVATILLATQWRKDAVLVLHLTQVKRLDLPGSAVYGTIEARVDDQGFSIDFPGGAKVSAVEAKYRIVNLESVGLGRRPPATKRNGVWAVYDDEQR